MKAKKVAEILLPYEEGIPLNPSVTISDKIVDAVELMVENNLKHIAVVRNRRPIGIVRFEDALQKLGLQMPPKREMN
ncbi:MAG: CBS domain-containing protein [Desulfobacteraceae bacterium]|jgi:CBS domain-containing protein|nr:MAG: CBS domain-containing protein [Desulfobacteraceae bacterium]